MSKFEYVVRNIFVVAFMGFLWMTTQPIHGMTGWPTLLIPALALVTILIGEVLWGEIVFKPANPLRRFYA